MSDAIQALAISQFIDALKRAVPGVTDMLPTNVVDMVMAVAKDAERDRLNDYTPVLPSIDQLNRAEALKELVKNLPFMPDRIDYLMDEQHGRCPAIEYDEGLFLPCCAKCKNGDSLCTKHKEKGTPFGNYAERLEQWQGGANVGKLSFVVGEKEYNELTFGQLIAKKKVGIEQIKQAIKDSHLPVRIAPRDLQIPLKLKKARGRPPQRKVQALDLDGEEQSESEAEEEREESPKPEKAEAVPSALKNVISERKAADKAAKEAEKALKDADKAAEKERKAAEKALKDAEKAAEKERKDAEKAAEKAAKEAAKAAEKAAKEAAKAAEAPKPKKNVKPKVANPVEASTDFKGDLSELNEAEDPNGNTVYVSDDNIVYNAQKKKIGKVDDEGNLDLD